MSADRFDQVVTLLMEEKGVQLGVFDDLHKLQAREFLGKAVPQLEAVIDPEPLVEIPETIVESSAHEIFGESQPELPTTDNSGTVELEETVQSFLEQTGLWELINEQQQFSLKTELDSSDSFWQFHWRQGELRLDHFSLDFEVPINDPDQLPIHTNDSGVGERLMEAFADQQSLQISFAEQVHEQPLQIVLTLDYQEDSSSLNRHYLDYGFQFQASEAEIQFQSAQHTVKKDKELSSRMVEISYCTGSLSPQLAAKLGNLKDFSDPAIVQATRTAIGKGNSSVSEVLTPEQEDTQHDNVLDFFTYKLQKGDLSGALDQSILLADEAKELCQRARQEIERGSDEISTIINQAQERYKTLPGHSLPQDTLVPKVPSSSTPQLNCPSIQELRDWYRAARILGRSEAHLMTIQELGQQQRDFQPQDLERMQKDAADFSQAQILAQQARSIISIVGHGTEGAKQFQGKIYTLQEYEITVTVSAHGRGQILSTSGDSLTFAQGITSDDVTRFDQFSRSLETRQAAQTYQPGSKHGLIPAGRGTER